MYLLHNDYNEICHPDIIKRIQDSIGEQVCGYGEDGHCRHAAELIRQACCNDEIAVHFLTGGTQANLTVIAAALRPHQAVLCAHSGHIHVHETGAIEATGHKILPLPTFDGKITAEQIDEAVEAHWSDANHEHVAQPKLVYISHPTEFGTTYTLDELKRISQSCKNNGLYLFVDGARLGYAMAAQNNDIYLKDLAQFADVFYIGGTKVGAMFGEAVVIANTELQSDFRYIIKQRGGMLAKGWLLGLQFETLFENDLYISIARHANLLAEKIRQTVLRLGYRMPVISETNQVFVALPDAVCERLEKDFSFAPWEKADAEHTVVRFCTSWATTPESVEALCLALCELT